MVSFGDVCSTPREKNERGWFCPDNRDLKVNTPCFKTNSGIGTHVTHSQKKKEKSEMKSINPYKTIGFSKSEKYQGNMK